MMLSQRQCAAFLAIIDHGSLGRAANALNVTQPALSRTIRHLEEALNVPLFERGPKGMSLTFYGEALLPHAKLLRNESERALTEIAELRGSGQGIIRIGGLTSLAVHYLPNILAQALRVRPKLKLHVEEGVEDRLVPLLLTGSIDVLLCNRIAVQDDIRQVATCGFSDRYHVVAAAGHPIHDLEAPTLDDVFNLEWALPPQGTWPRVTFEHRLEELGALSPKVVVSARSPQVLKSIVTYSHLLTWLPGPLFEIEETAGLLRRVNVPSLIVPRRFFIYARKRGVLTPAMQSVIEALKVAEE